MIRLSSSHWPTVAHFLTKVPSDTEYVVAIHGLDHKVTSSAMEDLLQFGTIGTVDIIFKNGQLVYQGCRECYEDSATYITVTELEEVGFFSGRKFLSYLGVTVMLRQEKFESFVRESVNVHGVANFRVTPGKVFFEA